MAWFVINSTGEVRYFLRELQLSNLSVDSEIGNHNVIFFCSRSEEARIPHLQVESFVLIYLFSINELTPCERDCITRYIWWNITAYTHINLCRNYFLNWTHEGAKKCIHCQISQILRRLNWTSSALASAHLISRPREIKFPHKIFRIVRFRWIYFPHTLNL